jgi:cytochrome c-type biogenesis protein CcmH
MRAKLAALLFFLITLTPALAVEPDEILPDPVLESRARALSAAFRCIVCQDQSIDDSDAPLARDPAFSSAIAARPATATKR